MELVMKNLFIALTVALSFSTMASDIESCPKKTQLKFNQLYSCTYNFGDCPFKVSAAGQEFAVRFFSTFEQTRSPFNCSELDAGATFTLAALKKM